MSDNRSNPVGTSGSDAIIPAVVTAITTTGSPVNGGYSAGQTKYTLKLLLESGGSNVLTNVVPANHRPKDTVNITPCPVNCLVWGVRVGESILFNITEYPDWTACP